MLCDDSLSQYIQKESSVIITCRKLAQRWVLSPTRRPTLRGLLSLINTEGRYPPMKPLSGANKIPNYLRLHFDDVDHDKPESTMYAPTEHDVKEILTWGKRAERFFLKNPKDPAEHRVLIHCRHGQGRSVAAAYILFCQALGPGKEEQAWQATMDSSEGDILVPNMAMLCLADKLLERNMKLQQYPPLTCQIPR